MEGEYYAFGHECPHQSTPLGGVPLMRKRLLRCPEHGSTFDVTTGECVLASDDGWKGPMTTFPCRIVDGVVEVATG